MTEKQLLAVKEMLQQAITSLKELNEENMDDNKLSIIEDVAWCQGMVEGCINPEE
jgi:hypothetical protein